MRPRLRSCGPPSPLPSNARSHGNGAHVSGDDAPPLALSAPDARVPKGPGKGRALEGPTHFHSNAHHGDRSEALNALLARVEACNSYQATSVRVQIVLLSIHGAVWSGEDERIVHEPVERPHITRQLSLAKRCLARV